MNIGVDADSGLVHSMVGTAANVNDGTQVYKLVHGEESDVFADAGYQGVPMREEAQGIDAASHNIRLLLKKLPLFCARLGIDLPAMVGALRGPNWSHRLGVA